MERIANGIWKMMYGTPEKFTPVSMRKSSIAREGLAAMDDAVLPLDYEENGIRELIIKRDDTGKIICPEDSVKYRFV